MTPVGPVVSADSCTFTVWAPLRKRVALHVYDPFDKIIPMVRDERGYWTAQVSGMGGGASYLYRLDGDAERPDPASHFQPCGVHGPSMVVDHGKFQWSNGNKRTPLLNDYILYELHIGAYTHEGTFLSAVEKLPVLAELGITAVELMPVAQFPGSRNWGYDGVYPFAVQNSYGGPEGLKAFVDACHALGLAVVLDVVYNHLGPEGNYLREFGPYFSDRYRTPWGESLNFDGPCSDSVCDYFIANACHWLREYRIDALRLDAVHAIFDMGARPFLQRLSETVEGEFAGQAQPKYLIAESDLNDARVIQPRSDGGLGMQAQWSDDFHHALHTLITGETKGYYGDFGGCDHMVRALRESFSYSGQYSPFRMRSHGNDVSGYHTGHFVVCSQNHDQIGNRMLGERLIQLADFERAKLAAAAVLLSPYIPLLFMGEEHAEDHPFLYFADHSEESLKQAVREGRKAEFAGFQTEGEPADPFDPATFGLSKIDWDKQSAEPFAAMFRFYQALIRLRKSCPAIRPRSRNQVEIRRHPGTDCISIHYRHAAQPALCMFNFSGHCADITLDSEGQWRKLFDSAAPEWSGKGRPLPDTAASGSTLSLAPYASAVYSLV